MSETAVEKGRGEIEDLLPWYANGRLSVEDRRRVEAALAADGELARRGVRDRRHIRRWNRVGSVGRARLHVAGGTQGRPGRGRGWRAQRTAAPIRTPPTTTARWASATAGCR